MVIHASSMVDACNVANLYLHNFKKYSLFIDHVSQFSLDIDPIILSEITGAQALRDLMEAGHLLYPLVGTQDCKCDILIGFYQH
jgi:hypothetical protein